MLVVIKYQGKVSMILSEFHPDPRISLETSIARAYASARRPRADEWLARLEGRSAWRPHGGLGIQVLHGTEAQYAFCREHPNEDRAVAFRNGYSHFQA